MRKLLSETNLDLRKCPNQKSESAGFLVQALPKVQNHKESEAGTMANRIERIINDTLENIYMNFKKIQFSRPGQSQGLLNNPRHD